MHAKITGVILAGGQATRMGGEDKGLIQIGGKALYQYTLARLKPQVGNVLISANRNLDEYRRSGLPVISDLSAGFAGPLAGMLAGLQYATTDWVVFVPCDVPDFPDTLVAHLWRGKHGALAAYASDGERAHPTLALLHNSLAPRLVDYLARGERKLMHFLNEVDGKQIEFVDRPSAFHNLNTPDDCLNWQRKRDHQ
ncbi:molybdenum cofactor guanylyltransferase MobA [Serratia sp. NPDC078593]|uniref:molybdenum cofactor guanylyltransferase MobA n=1 Tax=unclassified Serratia (in: enterobacteria) TaxID=2647522 RepID=UPI0037CFD4AB